MDASVMLMDGNICWQVHVSDVLPGRAQNFPFVYWNSLDLLFFDHKFTHIIFNTETGTRQLSP